MLCAIIKNNERLANFHSQSAQQLIALYIIQNNHLCSLKPRQQKYKSVLQKFPKIFCQHLKIYDTKMKQNTLNHYPLIEKAIAYLNDQIHTPPCFKKMAKATGMHLNDFECTLKAWANISPTQLLKILQPEYTKILLTQQPAIIQHNNQTHLNNSQPLENWTNIELTTTPPLSCKSAGLVISYAIANSPFGKIIIAATPKGICYLCFKENSQQAPQDLKQRFPHAICHQTTNPLQKNAWGIFEKPMPPHNIKLHLMGTPFQLKVWKSLLKIPTGTLSTYGKIATQINHPKSSRAVGNAIGQNPIAFLIPCHRVIQGNGKKGGYRWGLTKKIALLAWEAAQKMQNVQKT